MPEKISNTLSGLATLAAMALAATLLGACASTQREDLPRVDSYGLQLVENTRVEALYLDPDAEFSQFQRVAISGVDVAFRKDWLRDQNRDRAAPGRRITQADADRIKVALAEAFKRIFTEELEQGGYTVVASQGAENAADDLLLLVPAIVNLDITAPDTQVAGRSRSFTASAGSMSLYMEFHDSLSGALLGRVMDSQSAPDLGYVSISNSVTNKSEANRMLRKWARLLVAGLDQAHGK